MPEAEEYVSISDTKLQVSFYEVKSLLDSIYDNGGGGGGANEGADDKE